MHKYLFHKAVTGAREWGFPTSYECPTDRKMITFVSRCLKTDDHAATLVSTSRRLHQDDKDSWEKRRKDGLALANFYEEELHNDPMNLEGTMDKVVIDVKMSEGRGHRNVCRGCEETIWRQGLAVTINDCSVRVRGYVVPVDPQQPHPSMQFGTGMGM